MAPPSPATDFNFDSTSTSPYATAPSSPKVSFPNFYFSAPTSPTRSSSSVVHLSPVKPDAAGDLRSTDVFESCDKVTEQKVMEDEEDEDFAFDFSGQLERPSISDADELFHGGKIKPLHPPTSKTTSPRSSNKKYTESYLKAFRRTLGEQTLQTQNPKTTTTTTTTTRHETSRSLSPLKVSDILSDDHKPSTNQSFPFGFMWYNKWNLKNLLLFRSTSEGSAATINDPLKEYAMITKGDNDVKNSSFRSNDGGGSVDGSSRRRMLRKVSAHEIHYTANRAVAEEMRRKTLLPYKSGLLGCLGFSHNLNEISRSGRL